MAHRHAKKNLSQEDWAVDLAAGEQAISLTIRNARKEEAPEIARYINLASYAFDWHYWNSLAAEGVDPFEVGRLESSGEKGRTSYRNTHMAEIAGQCVGAMITYVVGSEPKAINRETTLPVLVPLFELENEALDSLYINTLATDEVAQGRGVGTAFLELAGELAEGKPLSLVCSDANPGARKLYERVGFRVAASRPMVKGDWKGPGENWLLMIKPTTESFPMWRT